MRICVALLALTACQGGSEPAAKREPVEAPPVVAEGGGSMDPGHCARQPFAESTPLPEASGAAWMTIDGALAMVVVADSGHTGDYVVLDPETGETREQGKLPLGAKGGDDLEGLAEHDGKLYGLTSSGVMRVWERSGKGFALVEGPYPIGDDTRLNYEGLALPKQARGWCAGFACSKADGRLYCMQKVNGRYVVDENRSIAVTKPGSLGDCTFDDTDGLWAGDNLFGLAQVFRIDGWSDPASAKVVSVNAFGVGFPEVISVRGDLIYRMSDTGGAPSLIAKFRCRAGTR